MRAGLVIFTVLLMTGCAGTESGLRRSFGRPTGRLQLPAGVVQISRPLRIPPGAHGLEIVGAPAGTVLRAAPGFQGRALITCQSARRVTLRGFIIDGNRHTLEKPAGLPPSDVPFIRFYDNNGFTAEDVDSLTLSRIVFQNVANYAVIVSRSRNVLLERVHVRHSGSGNARGRNNASGGILFEEGTTGFEVRDSSFRHVRGNCLWTHSLYTSPRNRDGLFLRNYFEDTARDAIQVGHATNVRVENNTGRRIGFPPKDVDIEDGAMPCAIDTAGDVDNTLYAGNRFEEINGKCIDLDGFHHGQVRANSCINRLPVTAYPHGHFGIVLNNTNPDMQSENILIEDNLIDGTKFGGIFLIGAGHRVLRNRLLNLNKAGCNESAATFGCLHFPGEPDLLQSGIYLGRRAERPALATGNLIEGNVISGHKMSTRCIGLAPGVSRAANRVQANQCAGGGPQ